MRSPSGLGCIGKNRAAKLVMQSSVASGGSVATFTQQVCGADGSRSEKWTLQSHLEGDRQGIEFASLLIRMP